jgi:hypothetical protein
LRIDGWLALGLLLMAGCSGASKGAVHGQVTLPGGGPAKGVIVGFENVEKHVRSTGTTGDDGRYELSTDSKGDGAPIGSYHVTVRQAGPADSSQAQPPRQFPARYETPESSGLTCEVKGGRNTYNIQLDAQ